MSDALKARLNQDIKSALKAGDKERLAALRFLSAAIKQQEVDQRVELDDPGILKVFDKQAKQRRESIAAYQAAGREDLVAKETLELKLIESYLPEPLTEPEIDALIAKALIATGASGMRDMGKVMAQLKPAVQGRADLSAISNKVKQRLS
jgi:hypothetical protein